MSTDRLWRISNDEFAAAVESINAPQKFARDEFVWTWQASYFRFVHAPLTAFPSLVDFAAMAVFTTPNPSRPPLDWAREVFISVVFPDRQSDMIETARADCRRKDEGERKVPAWLEFDGEIIDAFRLAHRGTPLCDLAEHEIYRTSRSFYYLCVNWES